MHDYAGFKKHKPQIPAQCGWPWQAGGQPCRKGCYSIHLASSKEKMAVREETVQGSHSTPNKDQRALIHVWVPRHASKPGALGGSVSKLMPSPHTPLAPSGVGRPLAHCCCQHSSAGRGRLGPAPTKLVSCPQLRQLLRKGISESLRLFFSMALTPEDYRNIVSPPPWILC